ncbi:MAG: hypothetical protein DCC68_21245 [Planctomycetota bacterium]|nr:MAG: hypothetical protein DCC68_21245 [Planctomycetota bacterium]
MNQPQIQFGNRNHSGDYPASDDEAAVVTISAEANRTHVIDRVVCSYDADPTGGRITVVIGGVTKFDQFITHAGLAPLDLGVWGGANEAAVITLAAGGTNVTGKLDVFYL